MDLVKKRNGLFGIPKPTNANGILSVTKSSISASQKMFATTKTFRDGKDFDMKSFDMKSLMPLILFRRVLMMLLPVIPILSTTPTVRADEISIVGSSSVTTAATEGMFVIPIPLIIVVAIGLGIAANGWIQNMIGDSTDDRGIGSFLRDGSGYNRSGFRPINSNEKKKNTIKVSTIRTTNNNVAVESDPLPWLKLPRLDFVEVAGQEDVIGTSSSTVYEDIEVSVDNEKIKMMELDQLRLQMYIKIQENKYEEATTIRNELEKRMKQYGIDYIPEK